jgi:hypothetical protein
MPENKAFSPPKCLCHLPRPGHRERHPPPRAAIEKAPNKQRSDNDLRKAWLSEK